MKRVFLMCCLWVVVPATAQEPASQASVGGVFAPAQEKLETILTSEPYSHQQTDQRWLPNEPAQPAKESDLSWLQGLLDWLSKLGKWSQALGVMGKALALLFLALLVWWIVKYRQTWLSWFQSLSLPVKSHAQLSSYALPDEDIWQQLPPKDKLLRELRELLDKGEWLPALSMLYRATLRELVLEHQLPIDKHQTEDECVWLLQTAQHASAKEQHFFAELVALWRASAYGRRVPKDVQVGDYASMYRLVNAWTAIYGGRL